MRLKSLVLFLSIVSLASAHTRLVKWNGDESCVRPTRNRGQNDPLLPDEFGSDDFICNKNGQNPKKPCSAQAGETVSLSWKNRDGHYLSESHRGPCIVWASNKNDPDKWFKVWELGYDGEKFCNEYITESGTIDFTIPSSMPAGEYVFRTELIALHKAQERNGAQFYVSCVDVSIQNSAGGSMPDDSLAVQFGNGQSPYSADDPGIYVNYRKNRAGYQIPGGPVAFGASAGAGGSPSGKKPAGSTPGDDTEEGDGGDDKDEKNGKGKGDRDDAKPSGDGKVDGDENEGEDGEDGEDEGPVDGGTVTAASRDPEGDNDGGEYENEECEEGECEDDDEDDECDDEPVGEASPGTETPGGQVTGAGMEQGPDDDEYENEECEEGECEDDDEDDECDDEPGGDASPGTETPRGEDPGAQVAGAGMEQGPDDGGADGGDGEDDDGEWEEVCDDEGPEDGEPVNNGDDGAPEGGEPVDNAASPAGDGTNLSPEPEPTLEQGPTPEQDGTPTATSGDSDSATLAFRKMIQFLLKEYDVAIDEL